jgi:coenzyme F420-dependent glucose-6-phosphate dehydrogenase
VQFLQLCLRKNLKILKINMALICYHASQEHFPPSWLLQLVKQAEQAGFNGIHSSEHFNPWSERQGQSGFTFSWIGAAMQATSLPFSMVCAPCGRYHPVTVAQAVATLAEMFPERFDIELGSGEALNEMVTGDEWPHKERRNQRLLEAATVIKSLLRGDEVNWNGEFKVKEAKLYTRPLQMPLVMGAAITEKTAAWCGSWADGLLTTAADLQEVEKKVNAFRQHGGAAKPVHLQYAFSYARTYEEALMGAWDQWRSNLLPSEQLGDFYKPEQFDEATKDMTPGEVKNKVHVYTSMEQLLHMLHSLRAFNPTRIILHNVNRLQEEFIADYAQIATPSPQVNPADHHKMQA